MKRQKLVQLSTQYNLKYLGNKWKWRQHINKPLGDTEVIIIGKFTALRIYVYKYLERSHINDLAMHLEKWTKK